ncbi:MAG: methyltransferase domain-containing protein [Gammaproteobacteria bacterium]|nr:methyltransferase domain-containing protein [Gammaproteobacteria bacterium]
MSTYAFMRWLESTPSRYDRGIRLLSRGRISSVYDRVAELAAGPGLRVLDVGCGTGGVTVACAARGAETIGIDRNAGMLEIATAKPAPAAGSVEWVELGAAEIEDRFDPGTFDAVVSCLTFSEMSPQERDYVLGIIHDRLRPGGRLIIADEVEPASCGARLLYRTLRMPVIAATWMLTQTTTHPVRDLADAVRRAGFVDVDEEHPWPAFVILSARRPS